MTDTIKNQKIESLDTELIEIDAITDIPEQKETVPTKPAAPKSEPLESVLRRFKKQSLGVISEVRKRAAYDKPSVKRKKKSKEARKRNSKKSRF